MAKKKAKTESTGSERFHIIVTPKAFKELLTPLKIEKQYDPTLVTFEKDDSVHINTHDVGKQTMVFIDGKYDGLRVLEPGQMVVNPTEMLKRVLPKFGSHQQFSVQEQNDGSYRFFDEWGAYIEWTPDSKGDCRVVRDDLVPALNDDGDINLFEGKVITDTKVTAKASVFQSVGGDAVSADADYIELNLTPSSPYSASGHLVAGTVRSKTPLDAEVEGEGAIVVVPASFSKFAAILTGEVNIYAKQQSPAIVVSAREPDRSYLILIGTTEPTEVSETAAKKRKKAETETEEEEEEEIIEEEEN